MRFVGQTQHVVRVRQLDDAAQVGTDAVVGGVVDQDGLGIGIFSDGPLDIGHAHAERDAQTVVAGRVDVDRDGAAQNHCAHDAAVHVARQNDFFAALGHGKDHALHG